MQITTIGFDLRRPIRGDGSRVSRVTPVVSASFTGRRVLFSAHAGREGQNRQDA
jgi:hypothetical protein